MDGPSNVTTTQTQSPPSFLIPGITSASNAALSQSGLGGFQQQQLQRPLSKQELKQQKKLMKQSRKLGIPFVPNLGNSTGFNTNAIQGGPRDTNFGANPAISNTAAPDPAVGLLDQSAGLVSDTLSGDFLDPTTNPFLEKTFNRAADLTQTRLASQFAGAGRDLDASLPARSQELQTLAAGIFGPNFQAERDRQVGSVSQAQGLDPLNQLINRLAGITPGAGGVTTSSQPVFQDKFGQAAGAAGSILTGLAAFSDRRLKRNIQRIGTVKGYPWYSFDYIWGERAEGVMADEVPAQFVGERAGYQTVDYGALLSG